MTDAYGDTLTKRVGESRVYNVDFATLDPAITTMSNPAFAQERQNKITPSTDLSNDPPVAQGSTIQVRLFDGTDGELYKLILTGDDQNGNTGLEITGWLEVEDVPSTLSLVVEDGTGKTDADSYVSLPDADAYFQARRNTDWLSSDPFRKEAALRQARVVLDGRYGWPGVARYEEQALDWPRAGAYDDEDREVAWDSVPRRVKDAQCEMALMALSGALLPPTARGGETESVKLGPLSVKYKSSAPATRSFEYIDSILQGLYTTNAARARHQLERA